MRKRINLTGKRFGRLVVKRFVGINRFGNAKWECICDCGNKTVVAAGHLKSGSTKSCSCLKLDVTRQTNTKHGLSSSNGKAPRLYDIWGHMRYRCLNKNSSCYKAYGGRGIKICEEWNDYQKFHEWAMANGYADNLTIERIDNFGDYKPSNCKWATRKEQARNRRDNIFVTFQGVTKIITEWAEVLGIKNSTLKFRLYQNWSVERAFTEPVH